MKRLVSCGLILFASNAWADATRATLTVNLSLRSSKGKVACTLYNGARGFPTDPNAAIQRKWCAITNATSSCAFDDVVAGVYAVGCFHDENDNGRLDTGLFGIPKEGVVVSNHARGTLGPPKWEDAKFNFAGQPSHIDLRMGY